ncbi:hypothetical protein OH77DRAFT_1593859 [Trametes cingulata]|nr:hypothetical protein OH77DRAFT_1593859 [Trametes cingulata]
MPRTRAAASTGRKPPKAEVGKRAKAAATKAKKLTPPPKPAQRGKAASAAKGHRRMAVDSEAEESEAEVLDDEPEEEEEVDLKTGNSFSPEVELPFVSDDEEEPRPEVELTPKIVRRRSDASSAPTTPKSPSPIKGQKTKPLSMPLKGTPAKRAKVSDSEEEYDADVSPVKKTKTAAASGASAKKPVPPLPRRQYIAAQAAAKKGKQQVEVVIKTPAKRPAKSATKPDSASVFFVEDTDDEEKARRQLSLFDKSGSRSHTSPKKTANIDSASEEEHEAEEPESDGDTVMKEDADAMGTLVLDIRKKLVIDVEDPECVDPNLKDTYRDLPDVRECEAVTQNGSPIHTARYYKGILTEHVNPKALRGLVTLAYEEPFNINPARFDPAQVVATTYNNSNNKVISLRIGGQAHRAICMTIGFNLGCNIISPKTFNKSGQPQQHVKSILFSPMLTEWERTMGFFGTVFDQDELAVGTFTSGSCVGVNARTFPSEAAPEMSELDFLQVSPSKKSGKKAEGGPVPSRSLLDMHDKTTWTANDDIPLWDATEYFKRDKAPSKRFSFDLITKLPRMTTDLNFGDSAIILYSASSYPRENGALGLSMNLYGVVRIAPRK